MDQDRIAKLDRGLLIVWVAASLIGRRWLPGLPAIDVTAEGTMLRLAPFSAAALAWWPLVLFAAGLPLAASSLHRTFRALDLRRSRIAFWIGNLGFVCLVLGLSLNLVEWTFASTVLEEVIPQIRVGLIHRFQGLWLADGAVSALSLWLLGVWVALVSWISLRSRPHLLPSWFGWTGVGGSLLTVVAGTWAIVTQGSLRTVDGGDALLWVHLWIGLGCALLWDTRALVAPLT